MVTSTEKETGKEKNSAREMEGYVWRRRYSLIDVERFRHIPNIYHLNPNAIGIKHHSCSTTSQRLHSKTKLVHFTTGLEI